MSIRVSRHVFGSVSGYSTLATSSDVTPDEAAELETFAFGQTNDSDYHASLAAMPAYWSRALSSGRRALTRVVSGPRDDQGRSSLRFLSAVMFMDEWVAGLRGEDQVLLQISDVWKWNGTAELPPLRVNPRKPKAVRPDPSARSRILSLIALIESSCADDAATIVIEPHQLSINELSMVIALLPAWYRTQFPYAYRSLSEALPVKLNCLAGCASRGKSRRSIIHWSPGVGHEGAKYASGLAHFWTSPDSPPWEFVANCRAFGRLEPVMEGTGGRVTTAAPVDRRPIRHSTRKRRFRIPGFVYWLVFILALVSGTGGFVYNIIQERRAADSVLTTTEDFLEKYKDATKLPAQGSSRTVILERADQMRDQLAAIDQPTRAERRDKVVVGLDIWIQAAKASAHQYESLEEMLRAFDELAPALGLDQPDQVKTLPDRDLMKSVSGWKQRLTAAQERASEIKGQFNQKIQANLEKITKWNEIVAALEARCKERLDRLEAFFDIDPPSVLSILVVDEFENYTQDLDWLAGTLSVEPSIDTGPNSVESQPTGDETLLDELRSRFINLRRDAANWRKHVDALRDEYQRFVDRAKEKYDRHDLQFEPRRSDNLPERWSAAQDVLAALKPAVEIWPDGNTAIDIRNSVTNWMIKAAGIALDQFEAELKHAEQVWINEQSRAINESKQKNIPQLPNPDPSLEVLSKSLDYWDKHAELIRYLDRENANRLHAAALSLKSVLQNAQQARDAATQKNSPDNHNANNSPSGTPSP